MSFLSGLTGAFNPMTLMGAAMGGPIGAIIAQALQQVVSQVVQQIIQQAGQQLGLPQQFIDMAQGAAAGSLGDTQGATRNLQEAISGFAGATGATGAQAGAVERETNDFAQQFINDAVDRITQEAGETAANASGGKGVGASGGAAAGKGGSVLMRIALAIGEAMDNKVDKMAENADKMKDLDPKGGSKEEMSQYNSLSAEMNALGQELKIVSEALNNTLKSIGEASSSLARKQ